MHGDVFFSGLRGQAVSTFETGPALLDSLSNGGMWFVVADFEGRLRGWKFDDVASAQLPASAQSWSGPDSEAWKSSHSQSEYIEAVSRTRQHIAAGTVYQANICRVLSAPLAQPQSPMTLARVFASGNPAPFLGYASIESDISEEQLWLVSASPELFFELSTTSSGSVISSRPIKGTARTADGLSAKDEAENVMITDLVRNDLSPLCAPGTVAVRDFLSVEEHPGLVHLVSTVEGDVAQGVRQSPEFWHSLFDALFPPGSVSGAPKSSALRIIDDLESHPRGPYCGGFGWVNADTGDARLAVGIRSFWWEAHCNPCGGPALHFGTGAGITWGSDPQKEWLETELKASRLIALASRRQTS